MTATMKVTNLQNESSLTPNIVLNADGSTTMSGAVNVGGGNISPNTGFVNRIINGSMTIDQRNAGASVTPISTQYSVDRFRCQLSQASKYSAQQSAVAPSGFTNSLLFTSLSSYSVTASDFFDFRQIIEGYNIADLGWGTASAQPVTLSFWVRSSLTGTFGGALKNADVNRSYPFTYTISAANTWEYKTITAAGDTTGTWATTNGNGLSVQFGLGVGSTYSGTAGAWAAGNFISATGATSVVGTSGATFYITGVQLEKGSTATPFEFRSIGQELALAQRYYETGTYRFRGQDAGSAILIWNVNYKITKRTAATLTGSAGTPGSSLNTVDTFSVQLAGSGTVDTGSVSYTASAEL